MCSHCALLNVLSFLLRGAGYKGESAHRIWRSIYEENCFFKNGKSRLNPFSLDNVCYEERVFYRAISGLHSSINIHLCASYALMDGTFTHNLKEFLRRFEGKLRVSYCELTPTLPALNACLAFCCGCVAVALWLC